MTTGAARPTGSGPMRPPELIHELRARSFHRLLRMAAAPGKRGFGQRLRLRIPEVVAREETPVAKAIAMAYLCSYLADHIVLAEIEACRQVEQREMTVEEQRSAWEQRYTEVVLRVLKEIPEHKLVLDCMIMLEGYTRLPGTMHRMRGRKWPMLRGILERGFPRYPNLTPGYVLHNRLREVLESPRSARAKARAIGLTASLIADIESWEQHLPWSGAYSRVMIEIYPQLLRHPDVLEQIVRLG
jgi:hypothetical protein